MQFSNYHYTTPVFTKFICLSNLVNKSFHLYLFIHYTEIGATSLACLYPFLKGLFEKYQDKVAPLSCVCTQYSAMFKTGALLFCLSEEYHLGFLRLSFGKKKNLPSLFFSFINLFKPTCISKMCQKKSMTFIILGFKSCLYFS